MGSELGNPYNLAKFAMGLIQQMPKSIFTSDLPTSLLSEPEIVQSTCNASTTKGNSCFNCTVCHRTFLSKAKLNYHLKAYHRTIKPYYCDICGKSFVTKHACKVHMIIHRNTEQRPFACDHCGKSFQTKQNLLNHTRIHLGEKPFKCTRCGKSFTEKSTLTKHLSTHSKEKRYSCTLCDQTFSQISSQQRHMNKFHNNIPDLGGFLPALGAEVVASELMMLEAIPEE